MVSNVCPKIGNLKGFSLVNITEGDGERDGGDPAFPFEEGDPYEWINWLYCERN